MSSPISPETSRTEYHGSVYPMNSTYGATSSQRPVVKIANETPRAFR